MSTRNFTGQTEIAKHKDLKLQQEDHTHGDNPNYNQKTMKAEVVDS